MLDRSNSAAGSREKPRRPLAIALAVDRLLAVGFGPTKPIADSSTPEGRGQNNRVELHNAQLRGRAIGGMPTDGGGQVAGDLCQ